MFCITLPTASGVASAAKPPAPSSPPSIAPHRMLNMRSHDPDEDRGPDTERPVLLDPSDGRFDQGPDTERPEPLDPESSRDTEPPGAIEAESAPDTERPGPPPEEDEVPRSAAVFETGGVFKPPRP
jgi:hypothetical protein